MKTRSAKMVFSIILSGLVSISAATTLSAQETPRPTSPPLYHLKPVKDWMNSVPSWNASFDIGRLNLLDKLTPNPPAGMDDVIPELKHTFQMRNNLATPIRIDQAVPDSPYLRWTIDAPDYKGLPYTVQPGAIIDVTLELAPREVHAGILKESVTFKLNGQEAPVCRIWLQGVIENGVVIKKDGKIERVLDYGWVWNQDKTRRSFSLAFDRRLPSYFPPGTQLKLVTTHDSFTLEPERSFEYSKDGSWVRNGVKIYRGVLTFEKGTEPLPQDFQLFYSMNFTPPAEAGRLRENLVLAASKPANVGIFRQIALPFQALIREPPKPTQPAAEPATTPQN